MIVAPCFPLLSSNCPTPNQLNIYINWSLAVQLPWPACGGSWDLHESTLEEAAGYREDGWGSSTIIKQICWEVLPLNLNKRTISAVYHKLGFSFSPAIYAPNAFYTILSLGYLVSLKILGSKWIPVTVSSLSIWLTWRWSTGMVNSRVMPWPSCLTSPMIINSIPPKKEWAKWNQKSMC